MAPILYKKGFKLFFHNKETDKTLPVGWTGTPNGMITKCKKLLKDNEDSHFEYTFDDGPIIKAIIEALIKVIEVIYIEESDELNNSEGVKEIKEPEVKQPKHITEPHAIKHKVAPKHLLCSSKNCDHEIEIEGNLEYKRSNKIYLICPKCGHKTSVHKIDTTNSLSYAVGENNKGTLIRSDGPKQHMTKKARLRMKNRLN